MSRLPVIAAVAVLLLAVACSKDSESTPAESSTAAAPSSPSPTATVVSSPAAPASPSPTPVATPRPVAEITPALLTAEDLPSGWAAAPPSLGDGDEETGFCGAGAAQVTRLTRVEGEFQQAGVGRIVNQSVIAYAPGDATRVLDFLRNSLRCTDWRQPDTSAGETVFEVAPLSFTGIGDQVVAARMTVKDPDSPRQIELVAIRRSDTVSYLTQIASGVTSADTALTQRLARRADERLAALR